MNQKLTLSLLGLTLAVVATLAIAPIVSVMAYAVNGSHGSGNGVDNAGVNGGVTGHDRACENSGAAAHIPHYSSGDAAGSPSGNNRCNNKCGADSG